MYRSGSIDKNPYLSHDMKYNQILFFKNDSQFHY